jgi:predicted MPP superfamily phosphohydrolase
LEFAPATRRKFLGLSAAAIGGVAIAAAGYGTLIEPEEIRVERVDIHLPQLPEQFDGLKIAQLSDLHYGPFTGDREIGHAVDLANAESPDITVLTGDFVTAHISSKRSQSNEPALNNALLCADVLARLRAPLGVFAALGNHDAFAGAAHISAVLESRNIRVLLNSNHALERGSARFWLAGVHDVLYGSPRIELALRGIPPDEPTALLVHEPDFADLAARHPVQLQLSGHSHGGQIRIPLLGSPYLPALARKYPYGYYRVGGLQLYTNRGIGTIIVPMRLGAPPEITLLTIHSDRAHSDEN